ncbi:class I SAM-dependent methyltransferase [Brachybacterium sp. AOP25-B2-12]|uniref:class I SAM-dependent methyltransferase n=1 Tax=Brachybacterium sp. AOP25-B2-12 TaxID=3457710 RepID=UPI004033F429
MASTPARTPDSPHVYTHGYDPAVLGGHRRRTAVNSAPHLLPLLRPGQRLLDVGSGAGTITADLVRAVAPGAVTAVEVGEEAAQLTCAELASQGLTTTEVLVADAHDLPFDDDTFDVVHLHQVLQHVADPVAMLAELRRVTRPGGIVAARDADYPAFRWFPDVADLDRWLELTVRAARANGGAPDAGRRLLAWAHAAGFEDVTPGAGTWCYATPADRAWWAESWAGRISGTALGRQILREGWADQAELDRIAASWGRWAEDPDGWFSVLHGEIIARA